MVFDQRRPCPVYQASTMRPVPFCHSLRHACASRRAGGFVGPRPLPAGAPGLVRAQEAGDLLLRALRHAEPDPVARRADAAGAAQEGEVVQVTKACGG